MKVSQIFFGERSELMKNSTLEKASLAVNVKYGFLACVNSMCGCCLQDWKSHLQSAHKSLKYLSESEREEIKGICEKLPKNDDQLETRGSNPIQGLDVISAFKCCFEGCTFVSESDKVMKKHISKEHSSGADLAKRVCLQAFSKFKGAERFEANDFFCSLFRFSDLASFNQNFISFSR